LGYLDAKTTAKAGTTANGWLGKSGGREADFSTAMLGETVSIFGRNDGSFF
jgi:hypothetical protein